MSLRWDIFCTVVDNYGDIGIGWRLARQLASEHGLTVRLWVDDLGSFAKIRPEVDPVLAEQRLEGVDIRFWAASMRHYEAADVVIELLACHLPEAYVEAMVARPVKPVWINLEYLSAEDWVTGCHALPSPHPRLPLTKYFYFPGWVAGTGGLLREAGLDGAREAFQASAAEQAEFWTGLGLPVATGEEVRVSLFSYENAAVAGLFDAWAEGGRPVRCLLPVGLTLPAVALYFGQAHIEAGMTLRRGDLQVNVLPMVRQDEYDHLLWACDCNFVRGEDSFVRAQWALRPFIWQAYPQEEGAHWPKISAFVELYREGLPEPAAAAFRGLWEAWNREAIGADAWEAFWRQREVLAAHARQWSPRILEIGDLAANLVKFCDEKSQ